jgi:hypothetical protein
MRHRYDFTVVIPHFRSFPTLDRLLSTIPLDRPNIQVVVVDDHSGDAAALDALKRKYPAALFLTTRDGAKGAGAARNEGLAHARGKWLLFADADDCFLPGAFDTIAKHANSPHEIVYFVPDSVVAGTSQPGTRHVRYAHVARLFLDRRDPAIRFRFVVPWSKMIQRELVLRHDIAFSEVIASNDVMFSLKTGHLARSIAVSPETIYCVTQGKGSLTTSRSEEIFDARLKIAIEQNVYLAERIPHVRGPTMARFVLLSFRYGLRKAVHTLREAWNAGVPVLTMDQLTRVVLGERGVGP